MGEKKVLLVEDEASMINVLADEFRRNGFNVLKAMDGIEGIDQATREHPDVILLDILMPRMDGLEMLKKLREDEWGKDAKVYLLTNLSDMSKIAEGVRSGVAGFLVKSDWSIADIIKKVKEEME